MLGALSVLVASAVTLLAGCSRPPTASGPARSGLRDLSPRAVVAELIAARQAADYAGMEPLICPTAVTEVLATLMAVDDFLGANRELCDYVRDHVGIGLAESIDQSHLGGSLDIFSRYAELLDETVADDTALVGYVVDGQLPARHACLRRINGTWRYDPGPGYAPQLPKAFHRMADGLRQVLGDFERGRLSADEVRSDPDRLLAEVRVRLLPGAKMLPRPPAATQTRSGASRP